MDNSAFGGAVPGLAPLRIQTNSLGAFDFRNGKQGLFPLKGSAAVAGTALDDAIFGTILLPDNASPRAVDLLPIFYTGVPNLRPYQLATGKGGNPLATGKPWVNNFLPSLSDALRLNMAVPATPRTDPKFSSLGLVQAAVLGLTDPAYNGNANLQFIPNMDGFPNGRRLEDDVTTIELQAVGGVALAAIGLWYDDFAGGTPVTPNLLSVLSFNAGVTKNDTAFKISFPFVQNPWRGFTGNSYSAPANPTLGLTLPEGSLLAYPNPFTTSVTFHYKMAAAGDVRIQFYSITGQLIKEISQGTRPAGLHYVTIDEPRLATGIYVAKLFINGKGFKAVEVLKTQ
jgi:hypothetical protein